MFLLWVLKNTCTWVWANELGCLNWYTSLENAYQSEYIKVKSDDSILLYKHFNAFHTTCNPSNVKIGL